MTDGMSVTLVVAVICSMAMGMLYVDKRSFFVVLGGVFFLCGFWRTEQMFHSLENKPLLGQLMSAEGYAERDSERGVLFNTVLFRAEKCREETVCPKDPVRISVNRLDFFSYGDRMRVSCTLTFPENGAKDGFDARMFFAKERVGYVCERADMEKLSGKGGNFVYRNLFDIRHRMESSLRRFLPEPGAGLAIGMLFGGSNNLSHETADMFAKTSMTHIVAVSGYNVSVLAYFFLEAGIIVGLWRRQAFWLAIAAVFAFVAVIGFPPSAVRAGIMGSVILASVQFGRTGNALNALLLAGTIMLIANPFLLRYDIGFQLSFLATFGILVCMPIFQNISKGGSFSFLSELFFTTISAQLFVFPCIAYYFHIVSFSGLIANMLILWMIPVAMCAVCMSAISGMFFGDIVAPFFWLTHGLLWYETEVIRVLASLDFGFIRFNHGTVWGMIAGYIGLAGGIFIGKRMIFHACQHHDRASLNYRG